MPELEGELAVIKKKKKCISTILRRAAVRSQLHTFHVLLDVNEFSVRCLVSRSDSGSCREVKRSGPEDKHYSDKSEKSHCGNK